MQSSAETDKLAEALALAQGELENASKDKTNPAFKSKYADITACLDVVRPALARHGLAVVQGIGFADGDRITVTTRLLHKSGQWIESTLAIPLGKKDAQGVGAASTYGRRYGLTAMVGLGQEDDDGNTASGVAKKPAAKVSLEDWAARFDSAKSKADIDAIAKDFVKLSQEQQTQLMPLAKAARTRCGL